MNLEAGFEIHVGSVKSSVARGFGLLSSTRGITVVVGFRLIASPESPCASETRSLFLAGNGRPSTAPDARSVVARPIARRGFYGGQPTQVSQCSDLTRGRSLSPHPGVTGSYDDRSSFQEGERDDLAQETAETTPKSYQNRAAQSF